jgi:hypothetical protein
MAEIGAFSTSVLAKPIAKTTNCLQKDWFGWIILQFLSQPPDMDIHRFTVAEIVMAPDVLKQLVSAPHSPGILHKDFEKAIFLR